MTHFVTLVALLFGRSSHLLYQFPRLFHTTAILFSVKTYRDLLPCAPTDCHVFLQVREGIAAPGRQQ